MANENVVGSIGDLLSGFAADVSGQGQTFRARRDLRRLESRRELSAGRKLALAQDAVLFVNALEADKVEVADTILTKRIALINEFGDDPSDTIGLQQKLRSGDIAGSLADGLTMVEFAKINKIFPKEKTTQQIVDRQLVTVAESGDAVATEITGLTPEKPLEVPKHLLIDLSASTSRQAKEAFRLAGGGKDGVEALNAQIALANTTAQRADVPGLLDASYPNATPQERRQLEAAVKSGKTVESGLKRADAIRVEQRRLTKGLAFQKRAITLLTKILDNSELNDVVGSVEGIFDFRLQDSESELIADIEEAQNILTVENMDLMKGVLSEGDLRVLKNLSSGALNRKRTFSRFEEDATTLRDTLQSAQFPTAVVVQTGNTLRTETGGAAAPAAPAASKIQGPVKFLGFEP